MPFVEMKENKGDLQVEIPGGVKDWKEWAKTQDWYDPNKNYANIYRDNTGEDYVVECEISQ